MTSDQYKEEVKTSLQTNFPEVTKTNKHTANAKNFFQALEDYIAIQTQNLNQNILSLKLNIVWKQTKKTDAQLT